ncbi:MAG: hypothetical protein NVS9B7_28970 [Flavisolibacter sp.]
MDIPSVKAVRNFVLSPFDSEGRRQNPVSWVLPIPQNTQPRLYYEASKLQPYKSGLAFMADPNEVQKHLQVIKGENTRPKFSGILNNLEVPKGNYSPIKDYYPLQYSLPATYGVGEIGLPLNSSPVRKAQAMQLKGYLLFYEQILVNYLQQLSHINDFFSIDPLIVNTYYTKFLHDKDIIATSDLYGNGTNGNSALNNLILNELIEGEAVFLNRRNRFLDHLLARFEESFSDYALMLYTYTNNRRVSDRMLIQDKIAFLKELPDMTQNRARGINYEDPLGCSSLQMAGLAKRIQRLLGLRELLGYLEIIDYYDSSGNVTEKIWQLVDENNKVLLFGLDNYKDDPIETIEYKANEAIKKVAAVIRDKTNYKINNIAGTSNFNFILKDSAGPLAKSPQVFAEADKAASQIDAVVAFAIKVFGSERVFIVEHILIRPRTVPYKEEGKTGLKGDLMLPVCITCDCQDCCSADPYSFRLTVVMNGEFGIVNSGSAFRRFAEDTIRSEVPAHLGVKICWISNDQLKNFEKLYCDWLIELAKDLPDPTVLNALLTLFIQLKNVYPKAFLHDCTSGTEGNRVFLDQTII